MTSQLYFIPPKNHVLNTNEALNTKPPISNPSSSLKIFIIFIPLFSIVMRDMSQKSSFACNRALADLGAAMRQLATMSLMPGAEKDGESGGKVARSIDLFPQQAGFGAVAPPAPTEAPTVTEMDASNGPLRKSQLTIFYGGKVLVFDNFPAEKDKDLMQMAGKSGRPAAQNFLLPPASATSKQLNVPATNTAVVQGSAAKPPQPGVSYLPIARNKSLHRFMEKRKDRIQLRAPYQAK